MTLGFNIQIRKSLCVPQAGSGLNAAGHVRSLRLSHVAVVESCDAVACGTGPNLSAFGYPNPRQHSMRKTSGSALDSMSSSGTRLKSHSGVTCGIRRMECVVRRSPGLVPEATVNPVLWMMGTRGQDQVPGLTDFGDQIHALRS